MENILEIRDLTFSYRHSNTKTPVLDRVNFSFEMGKVYAVLGQSGSGKSTLLALLGGMEKPVKGKILYKGQDIWQIGVRKYRNRHIGMIFQEYNLLEYMDALQNVVTAMEITENRSGKYEETAESLLQQMGISDETCVRNVRRLSGGEQQRVAIARALAKGADIILADEPTGNLDDETADEIMEIFRKVAYKDGRCVILVTHSKRIAGGADVILKVENQNLLKKGILTTE